jgi:precorrin-2 C20-methyltransferase/precorrin-3B C17-methyltransferase
VSLSDRLKPWAVIEQRLRAIASADLVLAIYNPASRSRREQVVAAQKLLLEELPADRLVVVGRDVGRAEESLTVTTLGALDADSIDMKCLVLVGQVWTARSVR